MEFIMKLLWRKCKREFVERITDSDYSRIVYDVFVDKNENWLTRFKKINVVRSFNIYNWNGSILDKKDMYKK